MDLASRKEYWKKLTPCQLFHLEQAIKLSGSGRLKPLLALEHLQKSGLVGRRSRAHRYTYGVWPIFIIENQLGAEKNTPGAIVSIENTEAQIKKYRERKAARREQRRIKEEDKWLLGVKLLTSPFPKNPYITVVDIKEGVTDTLLEEHIPDTVASLPPTKAETEDFTDIDHNPEVVTSVARLKSETFEDSFSVSHHFLVGTHPKTEGEDSVSRQSESEESTLIEQDSKVTTLKSKSWRWDYTTPRILEVQEFPRSCFVPKRRSARILSRNNKRIGNQS